ncbi:MAG: cbb3-type cytochrome c oxidase subunit I, partial [Anaerolineales bacterium]|nr:cbb3-type cytochrome c oxidase subunit I [Anaerolineales bacterium]
HGTVMIFLWLVPVLVGVGNFVVPLQIGAADMAFPRLNALSFWMFPVGGLLIVGGSLAGPAEAGWTAYAPLAIEGPMGQTFWILGLLLIGTSTIMGGINFTTTIATMRAPGMTFWKMPLFCWSVLAMTILILMSTPVLASGLIMQLFDRGLGMAFFAPDRGGDPLTWQHLFWFYSHPAVYIMVLPGMGAMSEVTSVFSRKPIFGYRLIAFSSIAISLLGLLVWAHHMFTTGVARIILFPIMITTMIIAVPTGVKVFSWLATMWGGKLWFRTPLLFAIGFISNFLLAGLTGVMQASMPLDFQFQDTYFLVAHLHYALFGGGVFAAFAGMYYWFPKMTGRMYNETLGRIHFVFAFIAFTVTYLPMFWLGMNGMPRRVADYIPEFANLNFVISISGFVLGFSFVIFLVNFVYSWAWGPKAEANPWRALSLEWSLPSPPPEHNFEGRPIVVLYPYDFGSGVVPPATTTAPVEEQSTA